MRVLLGLLCLALVAALVAFLVSPGDRADPAGGTVVERAGVADPADGPGGGTGGGTGGGEDLVGPNTDRISANPVGGPSTARVPGSGEGTEEWEVLGALVSATGDEPLWGYTVFLQPSGTRPRGSVPDSGRLETDEEGHFHAVGLDRRGPWDVYTYAFDPHDRSLAFATRARVGVARAAHVGEGERQVFRVRVGPTVVLRSPRPPEVEPEDLLLEARGRVSRLSSQIGGLGGYGRARRTPEGFCLARVPDVTNSVQDERFGVRAVTMDGLWSIAEVKPGRLRNDTRAEIDSVLEPRGKVAFRVQLDGAVDAHDPDRARHFVGWRLPLGDPARDELDLPEGLITRESNRPVVPRGDGIFEVHDLPIGPVEFRTREYLRTRGDETRYEVTLPVQASATHGDPDPVVVRIRAVH